MTASTALIEYLLRLGDNCLILGHRLSEWCGHGPVLEEDLALSNIALDLIGQAQLWLELAAELKGEGCSADELAYRRDTHAFRNVLLVEQPNGDFANTMVRQLYFDYWHKLLLQQLSASTHKPIADIASKALKEVSYHVQRSSYWAICLGDGNEESYRRMSHAIDALWMYTGELFDNDAVDNTLIATGVAVDLNTLRATWLEQLEAVLKKATLTMPSSTWMQAGGKTGKHSEHLGYLLAEMQFLVRAYPDARW